MNLTVMSEEEAERYHEEWLEKTHDVSVHIKGKPPLNPSVSISARFSAKGDQLDNLLAVFGLMALPHGLEMLFENHP